MQEIYDYLHQKINTLLTNEWSKDAIKTYLYSAVAFSLGGLLTWTRRNVYFYLKAKRQILHFITKKKYILVWNDDSTTVSDKITSILKEKLKNTGDKYYFKSLNRPEEILYYTAHTNLIQTIILIVSDVTKLSEIEAKRELIQDHLIKYVKHGGTLIGSHDLIYRRTRNEKLQKLFGGQSSHFLRVQQPIEVEINPDYKDHPLLTNISEKFSLIDDEVCWGDWVHDVDVLLYTVGKFPKEGSKALQKRIPMLIVRRLPSESYKGIAIWMSSCDKNEKLAMSISRPQSEIMQILFNAIALDENIKQYNYS